MKDEMLRKRGETLVVVPCWWDGSSTSLSESILFQRPDLRPILSSSFSSSPSLTPSPLAISFNSPDSFFQVNCVPDVGELMLAAFPVSPDFSLSVSPSNFWWAGEKYDGVRVCWNPLKSKLSGLEIYLPDSISANFGNLFLDAEFWFGREGFAEAQNSISQPVDETLWSFLRVVVFDDPKRENHHEPFETRYESVLRHVPLSHPFLMQGVAMRIACGTPSMVTHLAQGAILSEAMGEGIVLRSPFSPYVPGRSSFLFKLKAARGDNEALVVGMDSEDIILKLPNEQTFRAPKPDIHPMPKLGDIVMFTYENTTYTHLPIKPRVYRIRTDLVWDDVIHSAARDRQLNQYSQKMMKMPQSYWVTKKGKNTRAFLESFAKQRKFDPRIPRNWYSISGSDFLKHMEGAQAALRPFKGSFIKAVTFAFPELKLDPLKFKIAPTKFWKNIENRRRLFKYIAKKLSFDYNVPSNWYSVTEDSISHFKGVNVVLTKYYNHSLSKALIHIFPDFGWNAEDFINNQKEHLGKQKNQRKLFEMIAHQRQFDPLIPQNWRDFDHASILNHKGVREVLSRYEGSLTKALAVLFPDSSFDTSVPYMNWGERRKLFSAMVSSFNMDPLLPSTWYNIKRDLVASHWGIRSVLACYKGNLGQAVTHLFPEIRLDIKSVPTFSFSHRGKAKK